MNKDIAYHGDVVVFDLDDTLIRERDYCREGFRRIERILTEHTVNPEKTVNFKGIAIDLGEKLERRENYFDYLEQRLAECDLEGILPMLIESYRNNEEARIQIAGGMKSLLDELSARGVVMGIVTDGRSVTQRMKIKAAGIEKYFEPGNVIISEESGKDKSKPDNFRHFVNRYPEARRFIYIGDNERKDFRIPNLLGWSTFKVEWNPDNVHEDFKNCDKLSQASGIIVDPSEFVAETGAKG